MIRQRILVIDDDPAHLDSTRGILEAEGYEVATHDQPFGSTNAIVKFQPDLVLLDVNMPGLSGDKLADVYRANARTRSTRVMLYSSNDEDALREASKRLQLDGYICKGSPATLRIRVASVLSR
ncbi:MAG TPA: response regulator [Thermoanaerobaculia bacterium]